MISEYSGPDFQKLKLQIFEDVNIVVQKLRWASHLLIHKATVGGGDIVMAPSWRQHYPTHAGFLLVRVSSPLVQAFICDEFYLFILRHLRQKSYIHNDQALMMQLEL